MKIDILFSRTLVPEPGTALVQLLPGSPVPGMDDLEAYAKQWNTAVITPPFPMDGSLVMACVTPLQTVLQPMCFPDDAETIPGEDVFPVTFPWGKLALCCEADVFQPQYARLAALRGCTMMAVSFPWQDAQLRMAGPWSACQANCLPIALAQPEGGQLILPCPMTEDLTGFGRSCFHTRELSHAYQAFPVFHSLNADFYETYREVLEA